MTALDIPGTKDVALMPSPIPEHLFAVDAISPKRVTHAASPFILPDDVTPPRTPHQPPATLAPALRRCSGPNDSAVDGLTLDPRTSSDRTVIDVANPPPQPTFVAAVSVGADVEAMVTGEVL